MQEIRVGETAAAKIAIQFTSVSSSAVQTRLTGALSITVKIKRPGVADAVTGTGTFTGVDDGDAPGVREYIPAADEIVAGPQVFVFTATGMEPREIPIRGVYYDPYQVEYFAAVSGTGMTLASFGTTLTSAVTNFYKDHWIEWLTGPNVGCGPKKIGSSTASTLTLINGHTLPVTPVAGNQFRLIIR